MSRWVLEDCSVCDNQFFTVTKCGGTDKTDCDNMACNFCLEYIWVCCDDCGEKFCESCLKDGKCKECIGVE